MFYFFCTDHIFFCPFHVIFRDFSLVSTMKADDGMIVHVTSKYNYSSVCCYQSEVSKYEFSNSMDGSWIQADKRLGTP